MAQDNETAIRRRTHHYRVTQLTPHAAANAGPMALHVVAGAIDVRRLVVVRYVDFRTGYREAIEGVVKFSAKGESPDVTGNIRLATPADFRESGYEPGIVDDLDAAQQADMAPLIARNLSRKLGYVAPTNISVSAKFTAAAEPWVYCASIAPTLSYGVESLGALKSEFAESRGSDAAITAIDNPHQFARRLGIELALSIEVGTDVKENYAMGLLDQKLARSECGLGALPPIDTVLWVSHGPVHYEDRRLVIRTENDMPTMEALRACFTKRTEFSGQQEYRFAMSVAERPLWKAIYLQASGELLRLTRRVDAEGRR